MSMKFCVMATSLALALLSSAAQAATMVNVSGNLQGNAFTAHLDLDVVGHEAVSGTGTFTGYGLTNADLVLITTSTPGNENNAPNAPVGFRGNDGTDFFGLDQAYPLSTNGLLFDVGTTTASFGQFPLFTVYSNGDGSYGADFTGVVGESSYYAQFGSASVSLSTVPLPASAPMFGAALLVLGAVSYGARKKVAAAA